MDKPKKQIRISGGDNGGVRADAPRDTTNMNGNQTNREFKPAQCRFYIVPCEEVARGERETTLQHSTIPGVRRVTPEERRAEAIRGLQAWVSKYRNAGLTEFEDAYEFIEAFIEAWQKAHGKD